METALKTALEEARGLIDEQLADILPKERPNMGDARLAAAMRYSALTPGKRLRPFLVLTSSSLFGVSKKCALQTAAAIECVHAFSLVHDDLPALDDDDLRRGKPSCHKQYDEATAILAGDALLCYAFEIISHETTHPDTAVRAELTAAIAQAVGARGMIGGQMLDMISEDRELNIEEITRLQRMKTGALFAVSCEAGAILGKAARNLRTGLKAYAHDMGLAFQITDDLLDAEADEKADRQDKSSGKGTYVSAMGVKKARMQVDLLVKQAIEHLEPFGKKADLLRELARYVVNRKS